jgi:DNA end-binding protein Ku
MPARAMWKATLHVGKQELAVKLYAAATERAVHFRLLHAKDGVRVQQRLVHPASGKTVGSDDIVRGVEVEPGRFVVLDDAELAEVDPPASTAIEVLRFVPRAKIDHRWFERPYYLGPDKGAAGGYAALVAAMTETDREGVARWTMRKRPYVGALRLHAGYLALVALRHAEEVIEADELEPPEGRALDAREKKLASQLIGALAGPFEPKEYRDEYRERVLDLVARKRKGGKVKLVRYRPRRVRDDNLVAALERSLKSAG